MKTLLGVIVLLLSSEIGRGQQSQVLTARPQATSTNQTQKAERPASLKITSPLERRKVEYGGVLTDLARAKKPLKLLKPWSPGKFTEDYGNLFVDLRTGEPRGYVLFSLRF